MPHEPKRRHSKSVKRIRRAAKTLDAISLIVCKNCQQETLAHMACRSCGFYAGKSANAKPQVKVTRA